MRTLTQLLVITALAVAAAAAPALGAPPPPATVPGGPPAPPSGAATVAAPSAPSPGPAASTAAKARAYGVYCRSQSRRRAGHAPASPYGLCLTAMARLATQPAMTPPLACAAEPKRHVKGRTRTPFAECVRGGALLLGVRSQRSTIRPRLR